jgi:hypothetical protein
MRYDAHVTAYDMLDMINISATVRETYMLDARPAQKVLMVGTHVAGEGESDPNRWLTAALVALLERL